MGVRQGTSFLVHRKDLAEFRRRTGPAEATILLKPITRATLSAFLGLAVASQEERISAAHSLRADRDEILQCLIETNLKLQEYDQDRTNFLARAVHDFRAPLTAISGYCGLLLSEPFGSLDENQRDVLLRMQHSAKRLSRMASAMFQLSVGATLRGCPISGRPISRHVSNGLYRKLRHSPKRSASPSRRIWPPVVPCSISRLDSWSRC